METLSPEDLERRRYWKLRRREWFYLTLLLAAVLFFGLNFRIVKVVGISMEPTYRDGQLVLVWRLAKQLKQLRIGDVIVFRQDDGELIKRIVFVQDGLATRRMPESLWTPSGPQPVPVLMAGTGRWEFPGYEKQIKAAEQGKTVTKTLFVMGDNTWKSDDSRHFGPVNADSVMGKVILSLN